MLDCDFHRESGPFVSHILIRTAVEIPEKSLYRGNRIWQYSNKQVWKWIPVWRTELPAGEHELRIVTFSSRLRFE